MEIPALSKLNRISSDTPRSLKDKLQPEKSGDKVGLSEARVNAAMPIMKEYFSFYRDYPDLYLDELVDENTKFSFYFYQRVFLREVLRYIYMYATFPRAYSKSFLAILGEYLKCIFYPGGKFFIVAGAKGQAAQIATEKLEEIWGFFPSLKDELKWGTGILTTKMQKDYIRLMFKNGSILDVVAAIDSTRGGRRTGGLVEESVTVNGERLSQIIIPLMNVSRRAACGAIDPNDVTNKSQVYITTAGEKNTFAYDKLIQILLWSIIRPKDAVVTGGTWRIPLMHGLLDKSFVKDLKSDGTYSDETFRREYESVWAGSIEGSYFSPSDFDKARILTSPAFSFVDLKNNTKDSKIIICFDVGRINDLSSVIVMQIIKSGNGTYVKKILNIYSLEKMHFQEQAVFVKQKAIDFCADKIIIDGGGMGVGLLDFLTVETPLDPKDNSDTAIIYPRFGVDRKSDKAEAYKNFYFNDGPYSQIIYILKANTTSNSEMHKVLALQMASNKIQFLIDEKLAKSTLLASKEGKEMTIEERSEYLKPFTMTSILRSELMNLKRVEEDSNTTSLKRAKSGMKKDKFSALEAGIFYVRGLETEYKISGGCRLSDMPSLTSNSSNTGKTKMSFLERERQRKRKR